MLLYEASTTLVPNSKVLHDQGPTQNTQKAIIKCRDDGGDRQKFDKC